MTVCSFWMLGLQRKLNRKVNMQLSRNLHEQLIILIVVFLKIAYINVCLNQNNLFLCEVAEPVEGRKRKGKASRPLRIDLILQHDSLVPPPKESVSIMALCALLFFCG